MLRKSIFFIILIIVLSIFISNNLIKQITVFSLSKWTEQKVNIEAVKLNLSENKIIIKKLVIKNKTDELYFENLFVAKKIIINFKFKSIFNNPVIIDNVLFENPKYLKTFSVWRERSKNMVGSGRECFIAVGNGRER